MPATKEKGVVEMKRSPSVFIGILLAVLVLWGIVSYNGLVGKSESVDSLASQIEVQLERRLSLIPNLVNTVKGYARHEQDTIKAVSDARAKLAGAGSMPDKAEANQELSSALSRLLVVVERYPDLKANQNFIQLQDELAGTENRIAVARKDYNEAVRDLNKAIRRFPTTLVAGILGFEKEDYFDATGVANEPVEVDFNE